MRGWLGAALLAIAVAAATLAVLGYLSLRQWDASAELLDKHPLYPGLQLT